MTTNITRMDPEVKKNWLKALRSGKYKQGRGLLKDNQNRYCCLGVLCEISGEGQFKVIEETAKESPHSITYFVPTGANKNEKYANYPPVPLMEKYSFYYTGVVATMNDDGKSFEEIADHIEQTY